MIAANGHLRIGTSVPGGIDPATGFPTPAREDWSEAIPCRWRWVADNIAAKSNGERAVARLAEVLTEGNTSPEGNAALYDGEGREVRRGAIRSAEYLDAVGVTRITL